MRQTFLTIASSTALILAGILVACGKSPTVPSPPGGNAGTTPVTTRLEINGPRAVAPGATAQFTAAARMSDGTTRDVTTSAIWRTSPQGYFSLSGAGVVTGRNLGDGSLSASFDGLSATREVIVLPDGTYRLAGLVTDSVAPSGPVALAQVQVIGRAPGLLALTTFTDEAGRYRVYGVTGDVEVRVTKEGYQPRVDRLSVTDHQSLNIDLVILGQRPDVSGTYTLTIAAADVCHATLPEDARLRKFIAVLTQVGPTLTIALTGATFGHSSYGRAFNTLGPGTVEPYKVQIRLSNDLGYYYYQGPPFLEQLGPSRYFTASGVVVTDISPNKLGGELDGVIEVREGGAPPNLRRGPSCRSYGHEFTFTR